MLNGSGRPGWAREAFVNLAVLTLLVSCGKKEPPPSPDRWPPRLVSVKALDNLHVSCYFSEELDEVYAERRENYGILGPKESLPVIAASLDRAGVEVVLVTSPQEETEYSLSVKGVRDLAGNHIGEGTEVPFRGSLLPDTLPPRVTFSYPRNLDMRVPTDTSLVLSFSEPMDTATVHPILLPSDLPLSTTWSASMNRVAVEPGRSGEETLKEDRTYRLLVSRRGRDLGGNRLREVLRVTFSTGDSLPKGSVSGTVWAREVDPRGAVVLLLAGDVWEHSLPFSLSQVEDSSGAYVVSNLPSGPYFLLAAQRTGGKRWVGGYRMAPPDFSPGFTQVAADSTSEDVDITLHPESEEAASTFERVEQLWKEFLETE